MAAEKKDLPGEVLDYDSLLAHYREKGILDEPAVRQTAQRSKKSVIGTLLSDVSSAGEGKFSRKRGSKASATEAEDETVVPLRPQETKTNQPRRSARRQAQPRPAPEAPAETPEVLELSDLTPAAPQEGQQRWAKILSQPAPGAKEEPPSPELGEVLRLVDPPAPPQDQGEELRDVLQSLDARQPAPEEKTPPRKKRSAKAAERRKEKQPEERSPKARRAPEPPPREEPKPEARPPEKNSSYFLVLLEWLYIETYYIGVQLQRDFHLLRRRWKKVSDWVRYNVPRWFQEQHRRFSVLCSRISDTTLFPYREIARLTGRLFDSLREEDQQKEAKKGALLRKLKLCWGYLTSLSRPLNHIANFVAPIVGITILAATLNYVWGLNYALSVEYAGQHLGYISQENVFYDAQQLVIDRMMGEEYQPPEENQPYFRIVIADSDNLMDQETLANKIMAVSLNEVEEADGVYIEGAFLGALENGNEFLIYLDSILENYRTGIDHELVQFVKGISVRRGIYPRTSVVPLTRITQDMESAQTRIVEHKVVEGDTLSSIAAEHNVTVDQLLELNSMLGEREVQTKEDSEEPDLDTISLIQGERLTVARVTMDMEVKVTRREVYEEDIPYDTTSIEDNRYYKGYSVTLSAGINGRQEVTADVTYIDGKEVSETRIGTPVVLREPVNAQVRVGTMPILTYLPNDGTSSDSFMWPVKGGKVSAGLYGYAGHTGMDIAAPAGTEIRASKDGQVTYATNYAIWPYGKRVDISHGNGVMTRYAHCSAVFVTSGQYVRQGDLIALVGRTGNASGNHCHFEIKINGVVMNPANFIGNYWPGY